MSDYQRARKLAAVRKCGMVNPLHSPPDVDLVCQWGAHGCLSDGLLPWRRLGHTVVVLVWKASAFHRNRAALTDMFGPVRMAVTTEQHLTGAIVKGFSDELTTRAENRVPDAVSSRTWNARLTLTLGIGFIAAALAVFNASPLSGFALLSLWAVITLAANTLLKAAAAIVGVFSNPTDSAILPLRAERLPVITVLIPLFREKAIAQHLLKRLRQIDYPRDKLDVCLVMESDDQTTRAAISVSTLPVWVRPSHAR